MARPRVTVGASGAAAALLAVAFAAWLYGARAIAPGSAAWLLQGDPAQHYLGSVFFLAEPWHWPPGLITRFGEAPTSIVFTDAIPLLALLAKLAGVPAGTQYFGLWMVACHALAAVAGVGLLRRLGVQGWALAAGGLFFAVSPALLLRAYGHEALMGHFVVIIALERALAPWRWGPWLALAALATLVHPYFALMVAAIGASAGLAALATREVRWLPLLGQGAASAAALAGIAWMAGYFAGAGQVSASGQTFFSANGLTWIDPMDWAGFLRTHSMPTPEAREWTRWLPAWPQATIGQYEGFAYLGAGALLAVALAPLCALAARAGAGPAAAQPVPPARWVALLAAVALLTVLALSARGTLGTHVMWDVPVPAAIDRLLGIFRSSGRLIWPATYLLLACALAAVGRARWGAPLLVLLLAVQLADLSGKFHELRHRFRHGPPRIEQPLADPAWAAALRRCPRLELVGGPAPARWSALALAAGTAGAQFAPAPTARLSPQAVQARQAAVERLLAGQAWQPGTVYVLMPPMPAGQEPAAVLQQLPPGLRHLRADGHDLVLATACLEAR